jgi:hypothetical protein
VEEIMENKKDSSGMNIAGETSKAAELKEIIVVLKEQFPETHETILMNIVQVKI